MEQKADIQSTETLIRQAAKKVFTERGLTGARMQDIADEAGINRALLHYYFRSKEKLFELIFDEAFNCFLGTVQPIVFARITFFEKIERLVEAEIDYVEAQPFNPLFILNEMSQNPNMCQKKNLSKKYASFLEQLAVLLEEEHEAGRVVKIEAEQLFLNIISLIIFPFVAKEYVQHAFGYDEGQYRQLLQSRKKEVARFVIAAIKA
jgi:TetR/AcrR family transcriptional regulator